MFQAAHEFVSALHFMIAENFADKRYAGEVYDVGDRFEIIHGPYKGVVAEATKVSEVNGSRYVYARDIETGKLLKYPICFARQTRPLLPV